jgi:hypothetical protein
MTPEVVVATEQTYYATYMPEEKVPAERLNGINVPYCVFDASSDEAAIETAKENVPEGHVLYAVVPLLSDGPKPVYLDRAAFVLSLES